MKGFGKGELLIDGSTLEGRGLVVVGGVAGRRLGSSGSRVGGPSPGVAGLGRGGPHHSGRGLGLGLRDGRIWPARDAGGVVFVGFKEGGTHHRHWGEGGGLCRHRGGGALVTGVGGPPVDGRRPTALTYILSFHFQSNGLSSTPDRSGNLAMPEG
ncbi:hypothetical protein TIFTF001_026454 [Ficus carica]|uniref:Uncharacterized protein n=1 Tax=Ficus carica TaxID=3494 RepID=A0AA88DL55_FICCA|nr:hypothetical protein TIFTF001_026454 [Ficus carica]